MRLTSALAKSDEKVVVVRTVAVIHFNPHHLQVVDSEDMFGADDDDWAIYRKIVRVVFLHKCVSC